MFGLILSSTALLVGCNPNPGPQKEPPSAAEFVAASDALANHQPDNAITAAKAFLMEEATGPRAAEALYLEGRGFEERPPITPDDGLRNLDQARACYLLALQQSPQKSLEADIYQGLAKVDFITDNYADCIQELTAAMQLTASSEVGGRLLYRIGVCQLRLGNFTDADQTFRQVQQRYPNTSLAQSARQLEGQRQFYVQVATFDHPEAADAAVAMLTKSGIVVSEINHQGTIVIDDGPFATYKQAKTVRDSLRPQFPLAEIAPGD